MEPDHVDPYDFDHERGWRAYRVLRPGRGMYHDVKRRLPYYPSDITDAWTYRTFAGTVRIYFVKCDSQRMLTKSFTDFYEVYYPH